MKKLSYLFIAIAILLSDIMCAVVAFNYRDMICGIEHSCYSAPASPYSTSSSMTTKRVRGMLNLPNRSAEHEIGGYDP